MTTSIVHTGVGCEVVRVRATAASFAQPFYWFCPQVLLRYCVRISPSLSRNNVTATTSEHGEQAEEYSGRLSLLYGTKTATLETE